MKRVSITLMLVFAFAFGAFVYNANATAPGDDIFIIYCSTPWGGDGVVTARSWQGFSPSTVPVGANCATAVAEVLFDGNGTEIHSTQKASWGKVIYTLFRPDQSF